MCSPQSSFITSLAFLSEKHLIHFAINALFFIPYNAGDNYRYLTVIIGIKTQEKNTVDTDEENKRQSVIAGHRHRCRCRRHRHSGIHHLSLVLGLEPPWYLTVSPYFGTGQGPASAFCLFQYPNDRMPDSPAFRHS